MDLEMVIVGITFCLVSTKALNGEVGLLNRDRLFLWVFFSTTATITTMSQQILKKSLLATEGQHDNVSYQSKKIFDQCIGIYKLCLYTHKELNADEPCSFFISPIFDNAQLLLQAVM